MIRTAKLSTGSSILINPTASWRQGCVVSKTGVTVDSEGRYVVKAGTPLYGADAGLNRDTALTIAAASTETAQGVLYEDIVFETGETQANGVLVTLGKIDYLKLDSTVQAKITETVRTALPRIEFVKGVAD